MLTWVLKRLLDSVEDVSPPRKLFAAMLSLPKVNWLIALECDDLSMELGNGRQVDLFDNANDVDGFNVERDEEDFGVVLGVVGLVGKAVVRSASFLVSSTYAKFFRSMCRPSCSVYHPIWKLKFMFWFFYKKLPSEMYKLYFSLGLLNIKHSTIPRKC